MRSKFRWKYFDCLFSLKFWICPKLQKRWSSSKFTMKKIIKIIVIFGDVPSAYQAFVAFVKSWGALERVFYQEPRNTWCGSVIFLFARTIYYKHAPGDAGTRVIYTPSPLVKYLIETRTALRAQTRKPNHWCDLGVYQGILFYNCTAINLSRQPATSKCRKCHISTYCQD